MYDNYIIIIIKETIKNTGLKFQGKAKVFKKGALKITGRD